MSAPRLPMFPESREPSEMGRPRTRGDCEEGERPCPWVSCTHHAVHGLLIGRPGQELDDDAAVEAIATMPASCTLDVADEGGATLEAVAEPWGVTRERIRQIEAKALRRVRRPAADLAADLSEDELPASVPAPKRVAAARIDWMGEGDDPAVTDTAPAAMGAEEFDVQVERREGVSATGVIAAAPGAVCSVPGCGSAPQGYRAALDPALRPLCERHRLAASSERGKRKIGSAEAVALLMRRAEAQGVSVRGGVAFPVASEPPTPAADPSAAMHLLRVERDAARADVERLSRVLAEEVERGDRARARIEELEGQLLADATHRAPSPLARLAALAAVLVPTDEDDRIDWTIGRTRGEDDRWCASALGVEEHGIPGWEAEGDTPDEALAALVRHVEGVTRARIEALTAALGGAR